jgi:uncharacterized protein (TIGR02145 family)
MVSNLAELTVSSLLSRQKSGELTMNTRISNAVFFGARTLGLLGMIISPLMIASCDTESQEESENNSGLDTDPDTDTDTNTDTNTDTDIDTNTDTDIDTNTDTDIDTNTPDSDAGFEWEECVAAENCGIFVDARDNREYRWVTIETQIWMAENLDFETVDGSYCYNDVAANCETSGRLYTWAAVLNNAAGSDANPSGVNGICPDGWHVPSRAEWQVLEMVVLALDPSKLTGRDPYKAVTGWGEWGNGSDSLGFAALPTGYRISDGTYQGQEYGLRAYWWSTSEGATPGYAWDTFIDSNNTYIQYYPHEVDYGLSLRCIKNQ